MLNVFFFELFRFRAIKLNHMPLHLLCVTLILFDYFLLRFCFWHFWGLLFFLFLFRRFLILYRYQVAGLDALPYFVIFDDLFSVRALLRRRLKRTELRTFPRFLQLVVLLLYFFQFVFTFYQFCVQFQLELLVKLWYFDLLILKVSLSVFPLADAFDQSRLRHFWIGR